MHLEHSRLFSIEIGTFLVLEAAFKHLDACARAAAAREPRFEPHSLLQRRRLSHCDEQRGGEDEASEQDWRPAGIGNLLKGKAVGPGVAVVRARHRRRGVLGRALAAHLSLG